MPFDSCFAALISQLFHASPIREETRSRWCLGEIRIACYPIAGHNHADTSTWDTSGRVQPRATVTRTGRQKIRIDWHSAYVDCINSVPCTACTITYLQSHLDRRRLIPEPAPGPGAFTRASDSLHVDQVATRSRVHARLSRAGTRLALCTPPYTRILDGIAVRIVSRASTGFLRGIIA